MIWDRLNIVVIKLFLCAQKIPSLKMKKNYRSFKNFSHQGKTLIVWCHYYDNHSLRSTSVNCRKFLSTFYQDKYDVCTS